MMLIENLYSLGDVVYLKVSVLNGSPDTPGPGQVIEIRIYPANALLYRVDWANGQSGDYYDFQLTVCKYDPNKEEDESDVSKKQVE